VRAIQDLSERVIANVERVIVGKRPVIELAVVALLCEGHVLIEDVPGVGKTMLARALAASLGCTFRRLQFTPDLLPSDVTGVSVFNQKTGEFEFRPGPIFTHILLADAACNDGGAAGETVFARGGPSAMEPLHELM